SSSIILKASPLLLLPLMAGAEVKSLSSSELTETYIKDSTIIVTPKKQEIETTQKTYSSLTIAPVENVDQDMDKLGHQQNHVDGTASSVLLSEEMLRNAAIASATIAPIDVVIPTYDEVNTRTMEEVMNDTRYAVPEGDFDFVYIGGDGANDLGLSRQDNQLTFSIGNLPQIDKIELPHGIDEGPLQITPRVGGGFDLTINIPDQN
ncbi:hypothetical protein, partial [Oleiphilus sp. HI0132]